MSEKKMVNFQPEWVATFTGIYSDGVEKCIRVMECWSIAFISTRSINIRRKKYCFKIERNEAADSSIDRRVFDHFSSC